MEHSSDFVNSAISESAGKAQRAQGLSLASFFASMSVSVAFLTVGLTLFLFLKDYYVRIYQPRVYASVDHHPSALRPGLVSWLMPFFQLTDDAILDLCGLDSYLFLRYLQALAKICGPLSLLVVPSLLTLNVVKSSGRPEVHGMDELSWSNVATADTARLWDHFCCAICIVCYSCFVITRELNHCLRYLGWEASSPHTKWHLVLLTDIPAGMREKGELLRFFKNIPCRLQHIEVLHNAKSLTTYIAERDTLHAELEQSETKLIQLAYANHKGQSVKSIASSKKSNSPSYVSAEREQVRLPLFSWMPPIPFLGPKEDKIALLRKQLATVNRRIEQEQQNLKSSPPNPSAILQFPSEFLAKAVDRLTIHPFPNCMLTHDLGTSTKDIIWCNLGSTWWERQIRSLLVFVFSVALVFGWTAPIALTGVLSQLSYLAELFPWLHWVSSLPVWFISLLQGVLPQITLSLLTLIFPILLRTVIEQKGLFTKSAVELSMQKYYFAFLFIHLFLTVSISSGAVTVLAELVNSTKFGPLILARNLPKASNYFVSYILLQAFFVSGSLFIQLERVIRHAFYRFTASTPRECATRTRNLAAMQWGTIFPIYANLGCIVIIYSAIAPIILVIGSFAFALLWVAHRYACLYVNKPDSDNGGRLYPTALFQLFTGLYVMQLCLIGLFALGQNGQGARGNLPRAVMMGFALVCTALYHRKLVEVYTPLFSRTVRGDTEENNPGFQDAEISIATGQEKAVGVSKRHSSSTSQYQVRQPVLGETRPVVWIPWDTLGVSDEEVRQTREIHGNIIPISNQNAKLDHDGRVVCQSLEPPVEDSR